MTADGRTTLVTGAAGFIGSHLVERLLAEGWEVRAVVHYHSDSRWGWLEPFRERPTPALEVVAADVNDAARCRELVAGRAVVFHLAALISVPYSLAAPRAVLETNVMGTVNLVEAAREAAVRRFVQMSSSEVYGSALRLPIDEGHPLQAQSPYAASKIAAEKVVESFARSFGLPAICVRAFNTYGPRQSARAIVPVVITQALEREVLHLGALHPVRDLNFVTDTVAGLLAAAAAGPEAEGATVNIGSGQGVSIEELARLVCEILDRPFRVEIDPRRLRPERSEVSRLVCDNSRAAALLGWRPAISLREGLERTIAWIRDHRAAFPGLGYQV